MPSPANPDQLGNAGRPASQTPHSGASVATLDVPAMHAVSLLMEDHRAVEAMFGAIASAEDRDLRADLVDRLVDALEIHMQIEETVFYPIVERLAKTLGDEARHGRHEHEEIRAKILRAAQTVGDDRAALDDLEACVRHHVKDEEADLFPKLDGCDVDWVAVGLELATQRERLRRG